MSGFRFWSWLRSPEDLSAADKKSPRRTREKPLVPMVRKLLLEIKLALAIASYKFKMSSSYSFLGGLQLYLFYFFQRL